MRNFIALVVFAMFFGIAFTARNKGTDSVSQPLTIPPHVAPENPPRPAAMMVSTTISRFSVELPVPASDIGHENEVWVFLPTGGASKANQDSESSISKYPCLIYTSAGAPNFGGMRLSPSDQTFILPYVQMGFAVVCYETDGAIDLTDKTTPEEMARAADLYIRSSAGLVNARNAIHFALERFPEIDSDRLFTLGHSSGGKQALLLAANEPRIKGCVTFAPSTQLGFVERIGIGQIPSKTRDLAGEVERFMPASNADRLTASLLILYTPKDDVVRQSELKSFARKVGDNANLVEVNARGHFDLPDEGFRHASRWLAKQADLPALPDQVIANPLSAEKKSPTVNKPAPAPTAERVRSSQPSQPKIQKVRTSPRKSGQPQQNPYFQ
ncbi:alpha/beta hydrolase family protein [Stieleria varia]|uniref:Alpha/beta hydrolase family protein n=1 Tax=Stieleria varia TaxID=2528005 RepID=A0A5C6B1F9_9BACT|nr:dienelactone hydrolase family protein [Stieleria varia]TWU06023.1 Alpha/beta hydrolase family protein [Stieleria varia]